MEVRERQMTSKTGKKAGKMSKPIKEGKKQTKK